MKITFDITNLEEVKEVLAFLLGTETGMARTVTETTPKAQKKVSTTKDKGTHEKEATEAPTEEPKKVEDDEKTITLEVLKTKAQETVAKVGRELVKDTISKYAGKLADVTEDKYAELHDDLEKLCNTHC